MRRHFAADNDDGNITISKKAVTIIALIATIVGMVLGLVAQVVAFNERIVTIEQRSESCCVDNAKIHPVVAQNTQDIAVIKQQIASDKEQLQRIEAKLDRLLQTSYS